ncbi:MAG: class I fructose-bisphosphate aldolase [Bdellovibrionales bacterium]
MTERVREILSWYSADNPGVLTNLARLLNHGKLAGTGKMVILPVDQGFEHGPIRTFAKNPAGYDPDYHFELAIDSGCSAYAAPLGALEASAAKFAGEIPMILKINNSDVLNAAGGSPISAMTSYIDEALKLGCVGVGFTIYPGSTEEKQMYEEIANAARMAKEAGLVVVVWSYARGADLSKAGETGIDVISYAAQIAAQLGAHIIKVKPPTDHIEQKENKAAIEANNIDVSTLKARTELVLKSSFNGKRIVIFSGGAAKGTDEVIEEIKGLAAGGSFGAIMGRNAFQRPKAEAITLLDDIMEIYKGS